MTEYLDKVREADAQLRETIQEAHGLLKDIKTERKALIDERVAAQALLVGIGKRVTEAMGDQIKAGLVTYNDAIKAAIDQATEAVDRRFDTLTSIMLGEDKPTKESLAAQVRRWRETLPDR